MSNICLYWGRIPQDTIGGIDRVTNLLAKGFTSRGHSVYLIYCYGEEIEPTLFKKRFKFQNNSDGYAELKRFLKQESINFIINQRTYDEGLMEPLYNAADGIPILSCLHNIPGWELNHKHLYKRLGKKLILSHKIKKIYRKVYELSNRVVLLSTSFIPKYNELFLNIKNPSKLTAIPNPLSFDSPKIDLLKKEKIVLYVGRLEEQQKRILLLLRIWSKIEQENDFNDWRLLIVGDGPDKHLLESRSKRLKLKNIEFKGVQNPLEFYIKSSIFPLTSLYEGWGLVLCESLQCGVVPLAFDTFSALHDIIDNDKNGFIIPNNKIDHYVNSLKLLMSDKNKRNLMALDAINKSETFSLNVVMDQWESLFSNL